MLSRQHWLEVVQRTPLISIDLIVKDQAGRVLLGLRSNRPARDTWFVPGGVIRKGESIDQAFTRIAMVELGRPLQRSDGGFKGVYEHFYKDNFAGAPDIGTHYVVLAHEITVPDLDERGPLDQHRELRLFTPRQLLADAAVHDNTKAYFIGQ